MAKNQNGFALIGPIQTQTESLWHTLQQHLPQQGSWLKTLSEVQLHLYHQHQQRPPQGNHADTTPLLLHFSALTTQQLKSIDSIQKNFPRSPLLLISANWAEGIRFQLLGRKLTYPIDLKLELKSITPLLQTLLSSGDRKLTPARAFARTPRSESLQLLSHEPGLQLSAPGRFLDYSRMGAQILTLQSSLRTGERIEIRYESSLENTRRHRIECRVCYVHPIYPDKIAARVGVQFIAREEV